MSIEIEPIKNKGTLGFLEGMNRLICPEHWIRRAEQNLQAHIGMVQTLAKQGKVATDIYWLVRAQKCIEEAKDLIRKGSIA